MLTGLSLHVSWARACGRLGMCMSAYAQKREGRTALCMSPQTTSRPVWGPGPQRLLALLLLLCEPPRMLDSKLHGSA